MAKKLTERFLKVVKPPSAGRLEIADTDVLGLVLRVTDKGAMSWAMRYRPKGLAQRRETIGTYPTVTLAEARARAKEIAAAAARGVDLPEQEAKDAEAAIEAEAEKAAASVTLAQLVRGGFIGKDGKPKQGFIDGYCKANQRRWCMTERLLETHVLPVLGEKPAAEIRHPDIAELMDDLRNKKKMAAQVNRVRSQLHKLFAWGVEREYAPHNPVADTIRRKIEPPDGRDRDLKPHELRAIWKAALALPTPSGELVRAWILTGMRRDELRCARWDEIDLEHAVMKLPAARNKGKRDFELPLSPAMVELFEKMPRRGDFVFTLNGKHPYSGTKRLKEILDRKSGVKDWVFHDTRRTVRTGLAEINIADEIAERVMNHAQPKLTRTYNKHDYKAKMRDALSAWADRVAFLVSEGRDAPNVVELRPGA